jgi:transposase
MVKLNSTQEIIGTDVLDHLGLVAATIDKLGISKQIDKLMPMTNGAKTTMGQRATAMILNGLGFIDDRLYMFPKFLENKPVAKLFGADLKASDFNDDALGRFLDEVHSYGETKLYSEIALPIALRHKLLNKSVHFDTTSLSVYGDYDTDIVCDATPNERTLELPNNVKPDFGHSKNKRVDLKQMTLLLATTGSSGFPVWMESHSGNASDKKTLEESAQRMQKFCKALESAPSLLYVGDSAMYANCVKHGNDLLWLSRVPENMNLSKELLLRTDIAWTDLSDGYKMYPIEKEYGNVKQRWVLIYSEHAYIKEIATLDRNISKEFEETNKTLWHMSNSLFGCTKDIENQIKKLEKKLKYHQIKYSTAEVAKYATKGRPKKGKIPEKIEYQLSATLIRNEIAIVSIKLTKGRFILATNQLDKEALPDQDVLPTYKEQSGTESGFKFIKDDAFEIDSIFLKKPGRISALLMIMTLCLMVYSYAQYFLRQQLLANDDTIPSQTNKETSKPSMKWVYRLFHGIHVLKLNLNNQMQHIVLNLNELLRRIIIYFGDFACNIYGVAVQQ